MRKISIFKVVALLLAVVLILIWQTSSGGFKKLDNSTRVDAVVSINNELDLTKMARQDKDKYFDELDKVLQTKEETKPIKEYPNMEQVHSLQEMADLLDGSGNERTLLYFGSDSCSYCKALTPKISQLAQNYGITIKFVNMADFKPANEEELKSNLAIIDKFGLKTVPYLVSVTKGKIEKTANQDDSMQYLESFFIK